MNNALMLVNQIIKDQKALWETLIVCQSQFTMCELVNQRSEEHEGGLNINNNEEPNGDLEMCTDAYN